MIHRRRSNRLLVRGIAELLVIIIGVLIALAVDDWNQEKSQRRLSAEYMDRLVRDLRADRDLVERMLEALEVKGQSLMFLDSVGAAPELAFESPDRFLRALPESLPLGFNVPPMRSVTIDDMRSTGRLALIQPVTMREQILEYYEVVKNAENRIESRRTGFPPHALEKVPPGVIAALDAADPRRRGVFARSGPMPELTPEEFRLLVQWIGDQETRQLINAELNYSFFTSEVFQAAGERATNLADRLEALNGRSPTHLAN